MGARLGLELVAAGRKLSKFQVTAVRWQIVFGGFIAPSLGPMSPTIRWHSKCRRRITAPWDMNQITMTYLGKKIMARENSCRCHRVPRDDWRGPGKPMAKCALAKTLYAESSHPNPHTDARNSHIHGLAQIRFRKGNLSVTEIAGLMLNCRER